MESEQSKVRRDDLLRVLSRPASTPRTDDAPGGRFGVVGHLRVEKVFRDGTRELVAERRNQIVERALVALSYMWGSTGAVGGDPDYDDLRPWWIALGDGGGTAPTSTQTNIQGTYLYSRAWDNRTITSTLGSGMLNVTTYEFRVPEEDANSVGSPISEVGLFPYDYQGSGTLGDVPPTAPTGGMFARFVFSPVVKQSTFVLAFSWSFEFNVA